MLRTVTTLTVTASLLVAATNPAIAQSKNNADQALAHGAQAGSNASASAAHTLAASGQVVSGVAAVPLSTAGAVLGAGAAASTGAAQGAAAVASNGPLPIAEETISIIPPNQALKAQTPTN